MKRIFVWNYDFLINSSNYILSFDFSAQDSTHVPVIITPKEAGIKEDHRS